MSLVLDYGNNGGAPSSSPPTSEILYAQDPSPPTAQELLTPREVLYSEPTPPTDLAPPVFHAPGADPFAAIAGGTGLPQGLLPPSAVVGDHAVSCSAPAGTTKAIRRRRRSPPCASKFDINDNSLTSVYTFIRSFLSASTASTVAIDNKIEQAMDLVKSHLMFAVREEVDVLKERIGELMERINHLEYENTVLKKYATPETLQQLQHPNP